MSVTDLTGLIAAIASLGVLAPLAAGVLLRSHYRHLRADDLASDDQPPDREPADHRVPAEFPHRPHWLPRHRRALHDNHGNAAVLGGVGMLAGFGALFAMIAVG
jgi:hypothetical protein